jgi:hypothetical protein
MTYFVKDPESVTLVHWGFDGLIHDLRCSGIVVAVLM